MNLPANVQQDVPGIGIIADNSDQRQALKTAVASFGYEIKVSVDPVWFRSSQLEEPSIQIWLVDLQQEEVWEDLLDEILSKAKVPVFYGSGEAPAAEADDYRRWSKRLQKKLAETFPQDKVVNQSEQSAGEAAKQQIVPPIRRSVNKPKPTVNTKVVHNKVPLGPAPLAQIDAPLPNHIAKQVVILAASLGGPGVVAEFLAQLPKSLPYAFIYAQHIDPNFQSNLVQVFEKYDALTIQRGKQGDELLPGTLTFVSARHQTVIDLNGKISLRRAAWEGFYTPCIDQVMFNVAARYGKNCTTIVFSGMCDDGAIAAPYLKQLGGTVWAQSPESCAQSSMPDAVLATECVSYTGTPQQLAAQLVAAEDTAR